jgi:hypothetical protein
MKRDPAVKGRRGFRIRGGLIGLVLVAQAACYQRWERVYPRAQIVTGPVGLIHAGPGDRVVFERWRFVHFPMPFAVGGENFIWEVADERVREGEVIRLPDPAVRAEYQPIGHPAGRCVVLRGSAALRDPVCCRSSGQPLSVRARRRPSRGSAPVRLDH